MGMLFILLIYSYSIITLYYRFLLNYANFNKTILELDVLQVISQFNCK